MITDLIYRNFATFVKLVSAKALTIRPSTIVGMWRHAVLELIYYLQLRKVKEMP